jgi:hypothetical protein
MRVETQLVFMEASEVALPVGAIAHGSSIYSYLQTLEVAGDLQSSSGLRGVSELSVVHCFEILIW